MFSGNEAMLRTAKIVALIISTSLFIAIVALFMLVYSVDPNQYKPELSRAVAKLTAQPLHIDGDLSWSFYPRPSLNAHHLRITDDTKTHNPLLLRALHVNLSLAALFSGKLHFNTVTLDGLTLNYQISKTGQHNWKAPTQHSPNATQNHHAMAIEVDSFTLKNVHIHYANLQSGQRVDIENLYYQGSLSLQAQRQDDTMTGSLSADKVTVNRLVMTKLKAQTAWRNRELIFNPVTVSTYQGQVLSHGSIDFRKQPAIVTLQETFKHIELAPLFSDLGYRQRLSGRLQGTLHLTGTFKSDSLQGTAKLQVNDGRLQGINVMHVINTAQALLTRNALPANGDNQDTQFTQLDTTAKIQPGPVIDANLNLTATDVSITGHGRVDLPKRVFKAHLKAKITDSVASQELLQAQQFLGGSFPLRIKGSPDNYQLTPDFAVITKQAGKYFLKHELGDKLNLKKLFR
jgi:uncharacterized protein involved in outer membrane biogenesis